MPASKLSFDERSQLLARKAQEAQNKADRLLVLECFRVHGHAAVAAAKVQLASLGFIDARSNTVNRSAAAAQMPYQAEMQQQQQQKKQLAIKNSAHRDDQWKVGLGASWLATEVRRIRELLEAVDGIALSEANVKKLGRKHAKEPPREPLLKLFEFLFGVDPGSQVPVSSSEAELVSYLKGRYVALGRRGRQFSLPIDFDKVGVYSCRHEEGFWHIKHEVTEAQAMIRCIDDPTGVRQFRIEHNHSDVKAVLVDMNNPAATWQCSDVVRPTASPSLASLSSGGSVAPSPPSTATKHRVVKKRRVSLMPPAEGADDAEGLKAQALSATVANGGKLEDKGALNAPAPGDEKSEEAAETGDAAAAEEQEFEPAEE